MDTPSIQVQSNESCMRNGVDYSSLPPPTRKDICNISRKWKRIRGEPKDIIAAKWKAHVNILLARYFPAVEYRDSTNIEYGTASAPSILESVRLISLRALNIEPATRAQPVSSDDETVSRMAPLFERTRLAWSKPAAVPKKERFLINFRRNTQKLQNSIRKFREFSEIHLLPKRDNNDNANDEQPERKRPRTADF